MNPYGTVDILPSKMLLNKFKTLGLGMWWINTAAEDVNKEVEIAEQSKKEAEERGC